MISPSTPAGPVLFQFKAPRQPMWWAASTYGAGIAAGVYAWRPPLWWVVGGMVFIAGAAYFGKRRSGLAWALALAAFFLAGAVHIQIRSATPRLDTSILRYIDRPELQVTAHVTHEGRIQPGGFGEIRQIVDLESEQVQISDGRVVPVHSGIRLNIYTARASEKTPEENTGVRTAPMEKLHYGERIRCVTKLKAPRNFRNPGAFGYEGYLAKRGIAALGSAKIEKVERLPGFAGSRLAHLRSRMHASVIAKVHELWLHGGGADRRHDHRRGDVHRPGHAYRFSALRHVSHPGCFGDEREHSCVRHFLDPAPGESWGDPSDVAHGWVVRWIRIHHGGRRSRVACDSDVCRLSLHTPALSRSSDDECTGSGCPGPARLRSAATVHRQFPDDISVRADRGRPSGYQCSNELRNGIAGAGELGFQDLCNAVSATCGPVPDRPADDLLPNCHVCRRELGGETRSRHDPEPVCGLGFAFCFGGHANGAGAAHGLLLSSGDDDRLAGQSDCRAAHAVDDASCSSGSCVGVCLSLAGKDSPGGYFVCAGWHHGDDPRSGRTPTGRPEGCDAIVGDDGARDGLPPGGDLDGAAENRA